MRKLITKYSDFFVHHQWPSEHERWVELIFALVSRISDKSEFEVRGIIEKLDDYGLLDIEWVLKLYHDNLRIARRNCRAFIQKGVSQGLR